MPKDTTLAHREDPDRRTIAELSADRMTPEEERRLTRLEEQTDRIEAAFERLTAEAAARGVTVAGLLRGEAE